MEKKSSDKSVVGDVKMPKLNMSVGRISAINAAALSVAAYFGVLAIFGAIAGFTKGKWVFTMPGIVEMIFGAKTFSLFGATVSASASALFITMMLALCGGVIGLLTLKKLTNIEAVKKSWKVVAEVFGIITGLFIVGLIATALYALLGVGEKSGVSQGDLWLSTFLPMVIKTAAAGAISCVAQKVAEGKVEVLRIFSFVAVGIAAVALIIVVVQTLVGFYGKNTTGRSASSSYDDDWSSLFDF